MLFSYSLIAHDIEKLQTFLEHTVLKVWCAADSTIPFSIDLLDQDYRVLYEKRYKLHKDIEKIYNLFVPLSTTQKEFIRDTFNSNNRIEGLCCNDIEPIFYKDIIREVSQDLSDTLKDFNNYLYKFLDKSDAAFVKHYTSATIYYKELVSQLPASRCPFCGIERIKSKRISRRDAYDHYIPKSLLPFTAINVKNLAPMCKDCNESWKSDNNPIMTNKDSGDNRKTFYPFCNDLPEIGIYFDNLYLDPLDEDEHNIEIRYECEEYEVEVSTWRSIFYIDERYDDLIRTDCKVWLEEVRMLGDRKTDDTLAKTEYIQKKQENKFIESNFLTIPFLLACDEMGLLNKVT